MRQITNSSVCISRSAWTDNYSVNVINNAAEFKQIQEHKLNMVVICWT